MWNVDDTGTVQTTSKEPVVCDFGDMTPHTHSSVELTLTAQATLTRHGNGQRQRALGSSTLAK